MKKLFNVDKLKSRALVILTSVVLAIAMVLAPSLHQSYLLLKARTQVFRLLNPANHKSGGTGFTIKAPSGKLYTLTNEHVCSMTPLPYVDAMSPSDSQRFIRLRKIEKAANTDLCVLDAMPDASPVNLAGSFKLGEEVFLIGYPFLEPLTLTHGQTNTLENIDVALDVNLEESICTERGGRVVPSTDLFSLLNGISTYCVKTVLSVRTTLQTYPGNSGSPVLDTWGNLIGVLFAGNNYTNWGYMVPLSEIKKFLSIY